MTDTNDFRDEGDAFRDECGVFGIFGKPDAAAVVTLGLHALQHRGQEAAGIAAYDGQQFFVERHVGLIGDTFTKQAVLARLSGDRAIGHTRYSTTGGEGLRNVQPLFAELAGGGFAIAHNGNITNALTLQRALQKRGAIFSSTSDTETILHLLAVSEGNQLVDKFIDAITRLEGAYSFVALSEKKMIGARDPLGVRPLVLGDLDGAYILASETCALDIIGARFVRDVKPGEVVIITRTGIESRFPFELGIIRNHYVGRTFIQPSDSIRHMGVKLKHNANRALIEGRRVVLVDDSIVRGTTSQKIVQMMREAGAKEVHMRIASPPTMSSCFYGVDTPEKAKLLASRMSVEEMAEFIRVDSLSFLSIDGLYRAVREPSRDNACPQFCDACFTGDYPTQLTDHDSVDNVRTLSLLANNG